MLLPIQLDLKKVWTRISIFIFVYFRFTFEHQCRKWIVFRYEYDCFDIFTISALYELFAHLHCHLTIERLVTDVDNRLFFIEIRVNFARNQQVCENYNTYHHGFSKWCEYRRYDLYLLSHIWVMSGFFCIFHPFSGIFTHKT